jgi:hypothetical protein
MNGPFQSPASNAFTRAINDIELQIAILLSLAESNNYLLDTETFRTARDIHAVCQNYRPSIRDMDISNHEADILLNKIGECTRVFASFKLSTPAPISFSDDRSLKLPPLSLPTFSGKQEEWANFKALFQIGVHCTSFSDAQKFQFLRSHLKGHALSLIESFDISDYEKAYQALINRYDNPRATACHHYAKMAGFLPSNTLKETLQSHHATFTSGAAALRTVPGLNLEDFLLFQLAYRGLTPELRSKFERDIPSNKIPSFQQLVEFVNDSERAIDLIHSSSALACSPSASLPVISNKGTSYSRRLPPTKSTHAFTVVEQPRISRQCSVCHEADHRLTKCQRFATLTTSQKYDIVKDLKKCFACLGSHDRRQCTSTKACLCCGESRHNTLLCHLAPGRQPPPSSSRRSPSVLSRSRLPSSNSSDSSGDYPPQTRYYKPYTVTSPPPTTYAESLRRQSPPPLNAQDLQGVQEMPSYIPRGRGRLSSTETKPFTPLTGSSRSRRPPSPSLAVNTSVQTD